MAAPKGAETDYVSRKNEKNSEVVGGNRRNLKVKSVEYTDNASKKFTRAKSRIIVTENASSGHSGIKSREKGRSISDISKEDGISSKMDGDTINLMNEKKDNLCSFTTKKDIGTMKKDLLGSGQPKKENESLPELKRDAHAMPVSKKEVLIVKKSKNKGKVYNTVTIDKKKDESINPKTDDTKSEVSTNGKHKTKDDKKSDRKENGNIKFDSGKLKEIMNSDVTSSADVPSKVLNHSPDLMFNAKESGWNIGDLAWGRVGQHPFWPCMVAVDHQNGQYSKVKRVGRGLNSVQQSFHVQFFGDKGRHSWIPSSCVIKYEGKEEFQHFADKILIKMKKKDKRISSAFIVKPASKSKWELAIKEADESVPKAREDRISYFQELLPKRKSYEKNELGQKVSVVEKATQSSRKTKRLDSNTEGKPSKLMKLEKGQGSIKLSDTDGKKTCEDHVTSPAKKTRTRNKNEMGEFELSDASPSPATNVPRMALFLRRNIRKTLRQ